MSSVLLGRAPRLPIIAEVGESRLAGPSSRGGHQLAASGTCPHQWEMRYARGIRPKWEPRYRMVGTLGHVGLAYFHVMQLPPAQQPPWFGQQTLEEKWREISGARPKLIDLAREATRRYMELYHDEHTHPEWPIKTVWCEHEFSATIAELDPGGAVDRHKGRTAYDDVLDREVVTARYDRVVQFYDQSLGIQDYKFTEIGATSGALHRWKGNGEYTVDWQVLLGLKILRVRVKSHIVDGWSIRRIRWGKHFDSDTQPLDIPQGPYEDVGNVARVQVAAELEYRARLAAGEARLDRRYWVCKGTRYGPCDYRPLCAATKAEHARLLHEEYVQVKELDDNLEESYADDEAA